ncbi:DUF3196 family protein [Spiroplasma culicicola]|uniref:Uncharacterized protein n=1 Tax=Spiroplasma culicicola AES-1 TaxID=1276246 RepID=W6AGB3_9MOLU|nr:DUF3196 family protein [Spiroplasma culicicola]AHI52699.1 hypothetical protein SCULI_v1c03580 [Spiroplasma culicicola AES-1]
MENNYYQEIIEKINNLIQEGEYEQAMNLVRDELNVPYVPFDFENQLEEISWKINGLLSQNVDNSYLNWNLDKVSEIMTQSLDQQLHLVAFDALRGLNARKLLDQIKAYFLNVDIKNEYKTFLLMVLIEQKMDEIFEIKKGDLTIRINPATFDLKESQKFLKELEHILENAIYDINPSLHTVCIQVANTYYYNIFPDFRMPDYSINEIAGAIAIYSQKALGLEIDDEINQKINFNNDKAMLLLEKFENLI